MNIRDLYKEYLSSCVLAKRTTGKEKLFIGYSAVTSYMAFLNTDKLFDYDSEKWKHITNIFDITSSVKLKTQVIDILYNDSDFIERDKNDNQYYRTNAIKQYYAFLKTLELFGNKFSDNDIENNNLLDSSNTVNHYVDFLYYRPYITAIKSKPFLLLAGISGTGKSRIVRELARACWEEGAEEYKAQKPKNFEMIQVKPNWHDSSELLGYVSRVSGEPVYVIGDFLKFVAKAWENLDVPHFLCLDEMNLAPVEQYFAEYLSVIESRKNKDGEIATDAIVKKEAQAWYWNLCDALLST